LFLLALRGAEMRKLIIILVVLLTACSPVTTAPPGVDPVPPQTPDPAQPPPGAAGEQILQVDLPRDTSPQVSDDHLAALVRANNDFTFDLYRAIIEDEDGNLFYSPFSISMAFSMVYPGARGNTEAQMAEVMGFLPQELHHEAFNLLEQILSGYAEQTGQPDDAGDPFQLNIANSVWGQQDFPFLEEYLEVLARNYGAGMRIVDFASDAEAARLAINAWIEEQTEDRIQDMVPEGMLDALTRLVLVNAIYFKGAWVYPFDEDATQHRPFTLLDGSQVQVPLMERGTARINYFQGEGYQGALLPYNSSPVDMLVILPVEGQFEAVEGMLSGDFLAQLRSAASERDVHLVMPKLDFETDLDLKALLTGMGMTDPFGPADFSGISEGGGLFISDALHQANITVDEEGAEAAAATVIAMRESMVERADLRLDKPFIFSLQDRETGTILFLGRVLNPVE
jgi:serpin B